MKQFLVQLILFCALISSAQKAGNSKKKIVVFDIKEEIAPAATRIAIKGIKEAEALNADLIIIHMNTYGGLVVDADSIRSHVLNTTIPVYVFIDNNAASAGALISIACDKIYMRPGGSIGAATVVTGDGAAAPDKYQSYMRKQMRSTAESHGFDTINENGIEKIVYKRNPDIAEGMVDPRVVIEGMEDDDSTKVITLTTTEAIKWGYCEAEVESINEVLSLNNITDYDIIKVNKSAIDKIFGFFASPYLRGIFIMMMLGGLYFELQSPGIGFPIAVAGIGAILYFVPLYIDGLAANWEILIFIVGMVLIGIELFAIPGFGVAGISGISLVLGSLVLSMVRNVNFDFSGTSTDSINSALAVVFLSLIGFISIIFTFGRTLLKSKLFQRLVLADTLQMSKVSLQDEQLDVKALIGLEGIVQSAIRPTGQVMIDDHKYNAKSIGEFIDRGQKIKVLSIENQILVVKAI